MQVFLEKLRTMLLGRYVERRWLVRGIFGEGDFLFTEDRDTECDISQALQSRNFNDTQPQNCHSLGLICYLNGEFRKRI